MKITLIRQDSGSGKEALSICEAGTLFNKMKTETKSGDRKSTRLNSSHSGQSRMPSSA